MKLVEQAYTRIRRQILDNQFPTTSMVLEPELALALGMSRTPVREALIRLESEGLIEMIPRRGIRVLPISTKDMTEIYEIFIALEPTLAAAVARRGLSKEELASLEESTSAMENALEATDLEAWANAEDQFHRQILDIHGNERVRDFVATLFDQMHRVRVITLRLRDAPKQSTQEYRLIYEAIAAGEPDKAYQQSKIHRERTAAELLNTLDKLKLTEI